MIPQYTSFSPKDVYSNEQNPRSPTQVLCTLPLEYWLLLQGGFNWEAFYKALCNTIEINAEMINFCKATVFLL